MLSARLSVYVTVYLAPYTYRQPSEEAWHLAGGLGALIKEKDFKTFFRLTSVCEPASPFVAVASSIAAITAASAAAHPPAT